MFPELPGPCPHARPTRTRREFIRDGFCGFGGLALASLLQPGAGPGAAAADPAGAQAPASSGQGALGDLPVHGRRPEPPRDVRPQAAAEPARTGSRGPRSSARRSTSSSQRNAKLLGTRRTFRKYGAERHRGLRPVPAPAALRRRPGGDPVVPRRHGRALGRAVRAVHRPGHARASRAWARGSCYGLGSESDSLPAYVVMPDPQGRARGGPADVHARLPAGGLPADDVPARRPAGAQPRPAAGRRTSTSAGGRCD